VPILQWRWTKRDCVNFHRVPIAIAVATIVAIAAWKARALSPSGAVAAVFVGTAAFGFGDYAVAAPLIVFFFTGTLLSRVRNPRASQARAVASKGSTRDATQVLSNGGAAAVCAAMAGVSGGHPDRELQWTVAAIGAIAVAAADTWATEIGALSASPPRLITTGRQVRPGVSGGVTALGLGASLLGGALIGATASVFLRGLDATRLIAICTATGFAGATLDSLLGAAIQSAWRCDACDDPCEGPVHGCGAPARHVSGLPFVNNDAVNAWSTAVGAIVAWLAFSLAK
jgi:uncharacterized protein (TIGR00297 family)